MESNTQRASWDAIEKILRARDSKMYGYYKSVFVDGFEGGYPTQWNITAVEAIDTLLSKERAEGERRGAERAVDYLKTRLGSFTDSLQIDPTFLNDLIEEARTLPTDSTEKKCCEKCDIETQKHLDGVEVSFSCENSSCKCHTTEEITNKD